MRSLVIACLIAFALGLGVTVAYRMQTEAMAVVVGVVCGVSGTIPVSLLVLYAARSAAREEKPAPTPPPAQQPQTPQIIVVSPSLPPQGGQWPYPPAFPADPGALSRPSRDFTIIGDDD